MISVVGEHGTETIEAVPPGDLQLLEQTMHVLYPPELAAHELLAATPVLRHEPGIGKDGYVLLHCGEAHRVEAGQLRHGPIAAERLGDDVSPGCVGERVEQFVRPACVLGEQLTYNHLVVDYERNRPAVKPLSLV